MPRYSQPVDEAWIGLWGVVVGALLSLVGTVLVPWWRDTIDRKRVEKETLAKERRDALLASMAALLELRQARGQYPAAGEAQARFGARVNELTVRLTPEEQPILDVLYVMLAMIQEPPRDITGYVGESMGVLTRWARGDIFTSEVISEVETKAGVKFSEDRSKVSVV